MDYELTLQMKGQELEFLFLAKKKELEFLLGGIYPNSEPTKSKGKLKINICFVG